MSVSESHSKQQKVASPMPELRNIEHPTSRSHPWRWLLAIAALAGAGYLGYPVVLPWVQARLKGPAPVVPPKRAIPVVAVAARQGDMDIYLTGLGSVTALNTVTIRTRVDGQILKVAFAEGQMVQEGDVLAELDARPFEVQLAQAEGQMAKDQALLVNAQLDLKRYEKAGEAAAQQLRDTTESAVKQAEGAVKIDQAAIDSAKLNLTYCRITAPIAGRVGLRMVDKGNIVHASDTTGLAVLTQLQPISVVFSLPEDDIAQVVKKTNSGSNLRVEAYDRDLKTRLTTGTLAAIDNQIDSTTGTVRLKAVFDNQDNALFPNQFVNARLLVDTRRQAVLLPSVAIQLSPQSTFVYVVNPDNTVDMRNVVVGPSEGDITSVVEGLKAGELVVTDGVDKLQQGTAVSTGPAKNTAPGTRGNPATRNVQPR
jgi:membrane fusion protein, multidrug efflux system